MSTVTVQKIKHGYPLGSLVICDAIKIKALALAKTFWNAQVADRFGKQRPQLGSVFSAVFASQFN